MTNLIDIHVGAWDGRVFHFILESLESKPTIIQISPATGNVKTACLGAIANEKYLAIGSSWGTVNIWEKENEAWKPLQKITLDGGEKNFKSEIKGLAMDEHFLYTGSVTGKVEIFDMDKEFKCVGVIENLGKPILGVRVNDKAIFVISKDGKFTALDKESRNPIFETTVKVDENIKSLQALSIDEKFVCFASNGIIHGYSWDNSAMKLTEIGEFTNTRNTCTGLHIHKNLCYSSAWDGQLRIWDLEKGDPEPLSIIEGYGSLESVCADDTFIYLGGHDGTMFVIEIESNELAFEVPFNKINPKSGAPNQINVLFLG